MGPAARRRVPTLREVAKAAQLDISTVSRALRPETRNRVKPETVKRVLATADALGYRANPFARGLKDQRSMTIGMLVPDLGNPLFPPIVRGIEDGLRDHGYAMILANTDQDLGREEQLLDVFLPAPGRRSGARHRPAFLPAARHAGRRTSCPSCWSTARMDESRLSMVSGDDHQGIGLAVKHLVELGHRKIAFVGAALSASTGFNRYQYFRGWMQSLGLPVDDDLVVFAPWFTKDDGASATEELIERGKEFTAIVASSDMIALGCYRALRDRGHERARRRLGDRLQRVALVRRVQPAADQHPRAEVRDRPADRPAAAGDAGEPGHPAGQRAAADHAPAARLDGTAAALALTRSP